MGALLSHHVGRALGNSGADHHGATIHPGDDPPGAASKRRGATAADDGESSGTEVEEVDDDDVERARPAAATTRQWRPLRGQEGTSDHTRRVLELAGLPERERRPY